jgi:hypothetical protein
VKTIESAYKSVIENLCPDSFRLLFKYISKPAVAPPTPEYSQYRIVSSKFNQNELKLLKTLKNQFKTGIKILLNSRSQLLKSMAILGEIEKEAKSCSMRRSKSGVKEKIEQLALSGNFNEEVWDIHRKTVETKVNVGKKTKIVEIEEAFVSDSNQ